MILHLKTPDDVELFWLKMSNLSIHHSGGNKLYIGEKWYQFSPLISEFATLAKSKRGRRVDSHQIKEIKKLP